MEIRHLQAKQICRWQIQLDYSETHASEMVENTVGNGDNTQVPSIVCLLFPQGFQNLIFMVDETQYCINPLPGDRF